MTNDLSLDDIKNLLLFCKENQIHRIKLGTLEAELIPNQAQPTQEGNNNVSMTTLPPWVTGDV